MAQDPTLEELELQLADLKARWPAHSLQPHMFAELEELEAAVAEARRRRAEQG